MLTLGEWILRTSCAQMKRWQDLGHAALRIGVNLSPRQFAQRDLPETVSRVLRETRLDAGALELEVTEPAAIRMPASAIRAPVSV